MLFNYTAIDKEGAEQRGAITALNRDVAIASLQRRGFTVVSIASAEKESFFEKQWSLFEHVSTKDIVILSRQIATLFGADVPALRVFRLLGSESENKALRDKLEAVADDIQGGLSISAALAKHPGVFSVFYVSMVRSGEESGKLNETFMYLADHLDRSYELTSKMRNALIYPGFVLSTFVIVMTLMLTMVIPRLSDILLETGQEIPVYTRVVIAISNFFVDYGLLFLVFIALSGIVLWRFSRTEKGELSIDRFKITMPFFGGLYRKLYLARIADNMHTMLGSGISMVHGLEITADVVGNAAYGEILKETARSVKSGRAVSESFSNYKEEIPNIMVQIVKVGEETGELGNILKTLAVFYERDVRNAVDTLVGLIEPVMIVALGLGVGLLLTSVLIPIYNISGSF